MILEDIEEDEDKARNLNLHKEGVGELQLSLHNIEGLTTKKSLKLWGLLKGCWVVVLIDCDATHNFISIEMVDKWQLPITKTSLYLVKVGDGHNVSCKDKCNSTHLQIQEFCVQHDLNLFELGGVDVLLVLEWLASLGEIKANFGDLTMKVKVEG